MAARIEETGHYIAKGEIGVVSVGPDKFLIIQGTSKSFRILNPRGETGDFLSPQLVDPRDQIVTRPQEVGGRRRDRLTINPSI